jgi:hypothetical protein
MLVRKLVEVNAEKTKYMFMFYHQSAGQNRHLKADSKSFENVFGNDCNCKTVFTKELRAD